MKTSQFPPDSSSAITTHSDAGAPAPSAAVTEICSRHSAIIDAGRSALENAIRIGELLTGIKAGLAHGEWLPWLKANVPFTDRTARNYIRVFERRDELKTESVSDLASAYRLLAPPPQSDPKPTPDWEPERGCYSIGVGPMRHGMRSVAHIYPSTHSDYFFVNVHACEHREARLGGSVDGTVRAIRADHIARLLRSMHCDPAMLDWETVVDVGGDAWTYNEHLFIDHEDYISRAVLGLTWEEAAAAAKARRAKAALNGDAVAKEAL